MVRIKLIAKINMFVFFWKPVHQRQLNIKHQSKLYLVYSVKKEYKSLKMCTFWASRWADWMAVTAQIARSFCFFFGNHPCFVIPHISLTHGARPWRRGSTGGLHIKLAFGQYRTNSPSTKTTGRRRTKNAMRHIDNGHRSNLISRICFHSGWKRGAGWLMKINEITFCTVSYASTKLKGRIGVPKQENPSVINTLIDGNSSTHN